MTDIHQLDPKRARLNRFLLGVVILLGVLIVAAVILLIYGAIAGWANHKPAKPAMAVEETATLQNLPPGSQILDMKVDSGRTIVRIRTPQGEEIAIFDSATGKLITRIAAPK